MLLRFVSVTTTYVDDGRFDSRSCTTNSFQRPKSRTMLSLPNTVTLAWFGAPFVPFIIHVLTLGGGDLQSNPRLGREIPSVVSELAFGT